MPQLRRRIVFGALSSNYDITWCVRINKLRAQRSAAFAREVWISAEWAFKRVGKPPNSSGSPWLTASGCCHSTRKVPPWCLLRSPPGFSNFGISLVRGACRSDPAIARSGAWGWCAPAGPLGRPSGVPACCYKVGPGVVREDLWNFVSLGSGM